MPVFLVKGSNQASRIAFSHEPPQVAYTTRLLCAKTAGEASAVIEAAAPARIRSRRVKRVMACLPGCLRHRQIPKQFGRAEVLLDGKKLLPARSVSQLK